MEVRHTPVNVYPQKVEAVKEINPTQAQHEKPTNELTEELKTKVTKEKLLDKVDNMNNFLEQSTTELKYKLHEKLNTYYVQLIDSNTDEILKEIPQKKFLDMYASMAELAGLIVDNKI